MTYTAQIQSVEDLRGPAGRLEALLNTGRADAPYAALVCHPHPAGGGTMHNKVVYHAMKAFASFGLPVLRFNFRGTGLSEGIHDEGRGEQDDVRAALDWLHHQNGLPVLMVGFSFGAHVGLRACCGDTRVRGFAALGLPVAAEGRHYRYTFLASCTLPKLFVSGGSDEYGPTAELEQIVASSSEPKSLVIIADADHFFAGKLEQMQNALREWLVARYFPELRQDTTRMR